MKMFSDCSGPCETCQTNYTGGCLAGHGDDEYVHADQEWITKYQAGEIPKPKIREFLPPSEPDEVTSGMLLMLQADNAALRKAGCALASAAINVIADYDGLHRLALAVANWTTTVANEGGRRELYDPKKASDVDSQDTGHGRPVHQCEERDAATRQASGSQAGSGNASPRFSVEGCRTGRTRA